METDGNKRNLLEQFSGVTGVDEGRAKFYLESAAWNIEIALANFYEDPEVDEGDDVVTESENLESQVSRPPFGHISIEEDSGSDAEEEFYVGGSETSGQQVVGPRKNKKKSIIDDLFKSAKEHGAEAVDDLAGPKPRSRIFHGTGHRLGDTDGPSDVVGGAASPEPSPTQNVVLRLWKNGFCVNDGPLRDYHDNENQDFLSSIQKGEVPRELVRSAKGREVHLNMEDHRTEEYKAKAVAVTAFSGQGHMLGSPAPNLVSTPPSATPASATASAAAMEVNADLPITSIQIRLADGTRLVSKFNHSHRVADLRRFIMASRPEYANTAFILQTTFPNKQLTDDSQTLEEAKLLNAVIMQRQT